MANKELEVITNYYKTLCVVLPVDELIPDLITERVIVFEDEEEISSNHTNRKKAQVLLKELIVRSLRAGDSSKFYRFLNVIKRNDKCSLLAKNIEDDIQSLGSCMMPQHVEDSQCDHYLQHFTGYIKARYNRRRLTRLVSEQDLWPPFKTTVYNNLILIHQKNVQTFTESLVLANNCRKGNIESISEQTESITLKNLSQIFESLSQSTCTSMSAYSFPKSILIEGYPGIGKTTLAKEISLEWAEGRLLSSEKLVLLLLLRDSSVQKITSEYDLFKHFTVSVEEAKSMSLYFQNSHGQGLVVIIDGFDELNSELRQISFFRELIEGEIFPNALIVVTSRPSASLCLHEHVHRRIVILGFEQASKEQFIIDALKDYPSKFQELQQHFNRNPYMDSICYIPLNMSIMVYLCLTGYLPPTTTKMYETFILHTVCRHLKRTNIVAEMVLQQFPPVLATLTKLEKIAFKSLLDDKIVFTLEDLPDVCMEDPTCYGLLQSNECYASTYTGAPVLSLNFLHLGIQEYFAAKYVANLPDNDVYELMKETFLRIRDTNHTLSSASVHLSNMWVLFFGISGGRSAAVKKFLSTDYKPAQSRLQSLELSNSYSSDEYSTAPSSYYSSQCSSLSEPSSEEYFSLSSDSDRLLESSNTNSPSCVNNPQIWKVVKLVY